MTLLSIKKAIHYPIGFIIMKSNGQNIITLDIRKALAILFTAVLGAAGTAIWGTLAVANTIPFRVEAIERQVADFKLQFMPLDLSMEKWKANDSSHEDISKKLDRIENKVDDIIKDLK